MCRNFIGFSFMADFLHDRKELVTLMYEDAFLSYKTKDRTAEETQYVMNGM